MPCPLRLLCVTVVGVLVTAAAAPAQQRWGDLERLRARVSPLAYERLTATLDEARRAGVPTDPLVFKALEGVAKRVPEDRIFAVLDRLQADLTQAKALLEEAGVGVPPAAAITGVASALERGAPADAVKLTVHAGRGRDPTVALHTVAALMSRGVPAQDALDMAAAVLERGAQAREILALPAALDRLRSRGLSVRDAARELLRAIRTGQSPPGVVVPPVGPSGAPPGAARDRPPVPAGRRGSQPQNRPPGAGP